MAIDGRVHESLRRQLSAARPLVIDGAHDLDGCWALDRCVDESGAPTVVQQVLEDVRSIPEQRATMAVAARMAEHLQRYRWPADLVVSPVPSNDPVVELLARAVAVHLEVPCVPLLRARSVGLLGVLSPVRSTDVDRRISVRARLVPAHVLLIDDLVSSGRTLRACGSVLRARGAQAVWAMVAAADVRTDPPLGTGRVGAASDEDVRQRGDFSDVWAGAAEADEPSDDLPSADEVSPADVVPDEVVPDEVVPDEVVPDEVVPDEVVPDEVVQDEVAEAEAEVVPDEVVPDEVADEVAPDEVPVARVHSGRAKRRNRRAHKR
jgi:adenine/guanine phosphoribosyltransferase-like PRPP-binding protein